LEDEAMKIIKGWSLLVAAAITVAFVGCDSEATIPEDTASVDPEAMCVAWSTKSCASLSKCCQGAVNFDDFLCEVYFSGYCLDSLKLKLAHSDQYIVDAAAVQECLTPLNECDSVEPGQAHPIACANMLTGHRPLGAACFQTADCIRPSNGRAYCYYGQDSGIGVCANIVESTNGKCSFSKETLVYSTCPENTYCDKNGVMVPPGPVPSDLAYEFEAKCVAYRANGESCVDTENNKFDVVPCQKDLYCNIDKVDAAASKCQPFKKIGDPCLGGSLDECGSDAYCDIGAGKCVMNEPHEKPFCFTPPVCGDGECTTSENYDNCTEDCGFCGDDVCSADEVGNCSWDCPVCGDGICSGDEQNTCLSDCNQMNCVGCGKYVNDQQMGMLCPASQPIFLLLSQCMCAGACADVCGSSFCTGAEMNFECAQCAYDTMKGCGNDLGVCSNDI